MTDPEMAKTFKEWWDSEWGGTSINEFDVARAAWFAAAAMYNSDSVFEKDAIRYRWLVGGCRFSETDSAWDSKESLDAAIDEAMA